MGFCALYLDLDNRAAPQSSRRKELRGSLIQIGAHRLNLVLASDEDLLLKPLGDEPGERFADPRHVEQALGRSDRIRALLRDLPSRSRMSKKWRTNWSRQAGL